VSFKVITATTTQNEVYFAKKKIDKYKGRKMRDETCMDIHIQVRFIYKRDGMHDASCI
jgi:hypothetical protein